ncbi:MAG: response regulator transcription factor [Oscillospiraceae bacterium]|nr:response regulator transcription factor [Oscillospiraceae bacterium]
MKKILIIEDDTALANGLCRALSSEDASAESAESLKKARSKLESGSFGLVILDVNLPDGNGFDFLREIKEKYACPVVMLTANDLESDIVAGLEQGADDYITKPFSLAVLRARVNAQLRRGEKQNRSVFRCDGFVFDFDRMEFTADGTAVELSKTEQKLLRLLTENSGITLTREKLVDRIWTDGAEYVDENALSVTVKRLRDKLGAKDYIRTVYGTGYIWGKK